MTGIFRVVPADELRFFRFCSTGKYIRAVIALPGAQWRTYVNGG